EREEDGGPQREAHLRDGRQRGIGAHHEDGTLREVDDAQHAEHQREAEGEEGVDAAERQGVEELLFEHGMSSDKAGGSAKGGKRPALPAPNRPAPSGGGSDQRGGGGS